MLTITLASKDVLDQLRNWLLFFNEYKEFKLLCFCTDKESILFCEKNNIQYKNIIEVHKENNNNFWITKSYIFKEASKDNKFIYSDLDAIWIKNPHGYLDNYKTLDIVFSQGTYFPKQTRDVLGFVFCAGFFVVNNKNLKTFFHLVYDLSKNSKNNDDQYHINNLLMEELEVNHLLDKQEVKFKNEKFFIYDELLLMYSKKYKFKVGLLPHKFFVRNDNLDISKAIVVHPLSKIEYRDTIYFFHKKGLLHKNYGTLKVINRIVLNKAIDIYYFFKNKIKKIFFKKIV